MCDMSGGRGIVGAVALLAACSAQVASAADPPPKPKVTLRVGRTDVRYGNHVTFRGRIAPPPAPGATARFELNSVVPGIEYSDDFAGEGDVRPDGTFKLKRRLEHNARYTALVTVRPKDGVSRDYESNPVTVYVDYDIRTFWRRVAGGVIEAAMRIRTPAGAGLDYLGGRRAYFYGLRTKSDTSARRLFRARIYYTRDDSNGHAAAYAKRSKPKAGWVKFAFWCVPAEHPLMWGRPHDPFQTRCGRKRLRLPATR